MRTMLSIALTLIATGCVATEIATTRDGPATAAARTAPLPMTGSVLSPDFDPLAAGHTTRAPGPASSTKHDLGASSHDPAAHEHALPARDGETEPAASSNMTEHEEQKPQARHFTCPMHPEIVRDKPGNCPICGMKLEPVKPSSTKATKP